jgi:hypothetical protein
LSLINEIKWQNKLENSESEDRNENEKRKGFDEGNRFRILHEDFFID